MRSLSVLQNYFQEYLLQHQTAIYQDIISTSQVTSETRLAIYRDAYFLRLLEVLSGDYEILKKLLGAKQFDQLGKQYIMATPSRFRSVRWFGKQLPTFMRENNYFAKESWLLEMAEFEWQLTEAFDAADIAGIDFNTMAAIPPQRWPEMVFKLHPGVRRLDFNWNVVSLWKKAHDNKILKPKKNNFTIPWLIYREHQEVQFYSLAAPDQFMIDAMLAQENFATICEGLCEWVAADAAAVTAASLLKRFIQDGLVIEVIY
ncbi:MAG: DNA-binding domain-containing protein [Pseudomonadota bacterium]